MNRKQQLHIRQKVKRQRAAEALYRPRIERVLNAQVKAFADYVEQMGLSAAVQLIDSVVSDEGLYQVLRQLYVTEGPRAARFEEQYFQRMYGAEYDKLRRRQKGLNIQLKAFTFFTDWANLFTEYFNAEGFWKVRHISETTRDWLRKQANALLYRDLTLPEIRNELINESVNINRRRANVIARTETLSALNGGSSSAAKSLPLRMSHTWIATHDDRTRKLHRNIDGETVPLGQPYSNGGLYPGDPVNLVAKERIYCRCTELYNPIRDNENQLLLK